MASSLRPPEDDDPQFRSFQDPISGKTYITASAQRSVSEETAMAAEENARSSKRELAMLSSAPTVQTSKGKEVEDQRHRRSQGQHLQEPGMATSEAVDHLELRRLSLGGVLNKGQSIAVNAEMKVPSPMLSSQSSSALFVAKEDKLNFPSDPSELLKQAESECKNPLCSCHEMITQKLEQVCAGDHQQIDSSMGLSTRHQMTHIEKKRPQSLMHDQLSASGEKKMLVSSLNERLKVQNLVFSPVSEVKPRESELTVGMQEQSKKLAAAYIEDNTWRPVLVSKSSPWQVHELSQQRHTNIGQQGFQLQAETMAMHQASTLSRARCRHPKHPQRRLSYPTNHHTQPSNNLQLMNDARVHNAHTNFVNSYPPGFYNLADELYTRTNFLSSSPRSGITISDFNNPCYASPSYGFGNANLSFASAPNPQIYGRRLSISSESSVLSSGTKSSLSPYGSPGSPYDVPTLAQINQYAGNSCPVSVPRFQLEDDVLIVDGVLVEKQSFSPVQQGWAKLTPPDPLQRAGKSILDATFQGSPSFITRDYSGGTDLPGAQSRQHMTIKEMDDQVLYRGYTSAGNFAGYSTDSSSNTASDMRPNSLSRTVERPRSGAVSQAKFEAREVRSTEFAKKFHQPEHQEYSSKVVSTPSINRQRAGKSLLEANFQRPPSLVRQELLENTHFVDSQMCQFVANKKMDQHSLERGCSSGYPAGHSTDSSLDSTNDMRSNAPLRTMEGLGSGALSEAKSSAREVHAAECSTVKKFVRPELPEYSPEAVQALNLPLDLNFLYEETSQTAWSGAEHYEASSPSMSSSSLHISESPSSISPKSTPSSCKENESTAQSSGPMSVNAQTFPAISPAKSRSSLPKHAVDAPPFIPAKRTFFFPMGAETAHSPPESLLLPKTSAQARTYKPGQKIPANSPLIPIKKMQSPAKKRSPLPKSAARAAPYIPIKGTGRSPSKGFQSPDASNIVEKTSPARCPPLYPKKEKASISPAKYFSA